MWISFFILLPVPPVTKILIHYTTHSFFIYTLFIREYIYNVPQGVTVISTINSVLFNWQINRSIIMLTAMRMSSSELNKGLVLRGKTKVNNDVVIFEVVKTNPGEYWIVTGPKPGVCWNFKDSENTECWDFEQVINTTVGGLIAQIEALLRFYQAEA